MNEMIKVADGKIGAGVVQTTNARDLHAFLEVGKDFSTWIKDRVEKYNFIENQDFVIDSPKLGNQNGRGGDRKSLIYHISLDMAKELAMVERTEKGKMARQYFIEVERKYRSGMSDLHAVIADPTHLRTMLLAYTEKVIALEEQVQEQRVEIEKSAPAVQFVTKYIEAEGTFRFREVAKMLACRESSLREMMVEQGIQYKLNKAWMPKQQYIEQGYFVVKAYVDSYGQSFPQTYYTSRGVEWLAKRYNKWLAQD